MSDWLIRHAWLATWITLCAVIVGIALLLGER